MPLSLAKACLRSGNDQKETLAVSVVEIFRVFLKLGCISFGGPVAHLGYFENEFVKRRNWLTEGGYADLVALCQFLPGPSSSQVGLAVGWTMARGPGALAAWVGFTLPSALLMLAFAAGVGLAGDIAHAGWVQGLKVAAVAVVAQAVRSMARNLCRGRTEATLAILAAIAMLLAPWAWMQMVVLAAGALAGAAFCREEDQGGSAERAPVPLSAHGGLKWLASFAILLLGLPWFARIWPDGWLPLADGFYRSGALVFGGGHVVLPLLEGATVGKGWLSHDSFLAGYGAAQALPGPLFALAAYLGSVAQDRGVTGGLLALGAIYLPGVLLLFGALPYWERVRTSGKARALLAGANAAVVGILAATLYTPVWTSAIIGPGRLALALAAFGALEFQRVPPWVVVLACALAGSALLS